MLSFMLFHRYIYIAHNTLNMTRHAYIGQQIYIYLRRPEKISQGTNEKD